MMANSFLHFSPRARRPFAEVGTRPVMFENGGRTVQGRCPVDALIQPVATRARASLAQRRLWKSMRDGVTPVCFTPCARGRPALGNRSCREGVKEREDSKAKRVDSGLSSTGG